MANSIRYDPNFTLIAITGGPCGGKSTFLAQARQRLENYNMQVAVLPETATELINAGLSPEKGWEDDLAFQEELLLYSLEREDHYWKMMQRLEGNERKVLLCDRGVLDAMAYVGRKHYLKALERYGLKLHDLRERYSAVVHMVTAADGALEHYTCENNPARTETPEEARELDQKTQAAWNGHRNLLVVDNRTNFEGKINRAFSSLARVLNMPEPREKERVFEIFNFNLDDLPDEAKEVKIRQIYLMSEEPGVERRVRKWTVDGSSSYYYTEKKPTGNGPKDRFESPDPEISLREFERLIEEERDPGLQEIRKTRYCFEYAGHLLEVDEFIQPIDNLVVCEVEVGDLDERIALPEYWEYEELHGSRYEKHKNHKIAGGSLS